MSHDQLCHTDLYLYLLICLVPSGSVQGTLLKVPVKLKKDDFYLFIECCSIYYNLFSSCIII